jgi:hypothetical protein
VFLIFKIAFYIFYFVINKKKIIYINIIKELNKMFFALIILINKFHNNIFFCFNINYKFIIKYILRNIYNKSSTIYINYYSTFKSL